MNQLVESPFGAPVLQESSGTRQLQAREEAEILAMVGMAKRFPRDVVLCMDKILNAFTRVTLAESATYQFSKGGSDVSGASIRAAEAIAQMWGNMQMGFREVSRQTGADGRTFSVVESFCWDLESMNRQALQFIVPHWRDTKRGGYALKDEREIYELMANQAQRRKRACILALIPGDVAEAAIRQADVTLRTKADTGPEAMAAMVLAFEPFGVKKHHIEKRIQRRLDTIAPAQVVQLKRIYASLRDDVSVPSDWFEIEEAEAGTTTTSTSTGAAAASTAAPVAKTLPTCSADEFTKKSSGWKNIVANGTKTVNDLIATIQLKTLLTEEQRMEIASWALPATTNQDQSDEGETQ